jgi:hypothetical protein
MSDQMPDREASERARTTSQRGELELLDMLDSQRIARQSSRVILSIT